MDEGTLKTPHQSLNVVFSGHFCLEWCSNFVGSESGQKRSVKLLLNMDYNTTPPPKKKKSQKHVDPVDPDPDSDPDPRHCI